MGKRREYMRKMREAGDTIYFSYPRFPVNVTDLLMNKCTYFLTNCFEILIIKQTYIEV